ncbi:MAG: hypothetical protein ACRDRG_10475, partial [Pseudonocardiaceae bacterium]
GFATATTACSARLSSRARIATASRVRHRYHGMQRPAFESGEDRNGSSGAAGSFGEPQRPAFESGEDRNPGLAAVVLLAASQRPAFESGEDRNGTSSAA